MLGVPLPPGPGGTLAPSAPVAGGATAPATTRPASALRLVQRGDISAPPVGRACLPAMVHGSATEPLSVRYRRGRAARAGRRGTKRARQTLLVGRARRWGEQDS